MSWLDEARVRAQQIADLALAPTPPAPHPAALNPTLRVAAAPTAGDRDPVVRSAKADANGVITVQLDPVEPGTVELVDYLTVSTMNAAGTGPSANATTCVVYDSYVDQGHIFDATNDGNGAVAAYTPARRLPATHVLIAVWVGAVPNVDTGVVRYERHIQQAGG